MNYIILRRGKIEFCLFLTRGMVATKILFEIITYYLMFALFLRTHYEVQNYVTVVS